MGRRPYRQSGPLAGGQSGSFYAASPVDLRGVGETCRQQGRLIQSRPPAGSLIHGGGLWHELTSIAAFPTTPAHTQHTSPYHTSKHEPTCTYTHTDWHARSHTHTHRQGHIPAHTHTHPPRHIGAHTYTQDINTNSSPDTLINKHAGKQAGRQPHRTPARTHTYEHIYTRASTLT